MVKSIALHSKQEQRWVTGAPQPIEYHTYIGLSLLLYMPSRNRGESQVHLNPYQTPALKEGGWSTPLPGRFIPGKRPGTRCTGGWVGVLTWLDGSGKSRFHQVFEPRTVRHVALLTTLSWPPYICMYYTVPCTRNVRRMWSLLIWGVQCNKTMRFVISFVTAFDT